MSQLLTSSLINNATLLLALSIIYEVGYLMPPKYNRFRPVIYGIMTALICIAIMKTSFTLKPGVVFDTRSILISVTALTFGRVPTAITVIASSIFRLSAGGSGALAGIAVIISSALIGLAWRRFIYPRFKKQRWLIIYVMGIAVHANMLACMLLLPSPDNMMIIREISLPVMLIYPIASLLLSLLLLRQQEHTYFQAQLRESEKKYSSYIENAPTGVFVTDQKGQYIEVNKAATEITGYNKEELLQMRIRDITTKESLHKAISSFRVLLKTGTMSAVLQYIHKNGSKRWWSINAVKLSDNRFLGFASDITDKKKAEEEHIYLIYHDYLTECYNRKYFEETKTQFDKEGRFPISILVADINGVRLINDAFGYTVGDKLIKETSKILQKCCREEDVLARVGGDEFSLILPCTNRKTAHTIINKIQTECEKYNEKTRKNYMKSVFPSAVIQRKPLTKALMKQQKWRMNICATKSY